MYNALSVYFFVPLVFKNDNKMKQFKASELILNDDGSIYHLHLRPEHIAPNIILVGDQDRVPMVSQHFDEIIYRHQKREFVSHTGFIGKVKFMVISTGIGTDNIDIVLNELDALANIDLATRTEKAEHTALNFIRIGTSGTLVKDVACDSILYSEFGLSLDGLMNFYRYENNALEQQILDVINKAIPNLAIEPKLSTASSKLLDFFDDGNIIKGITASCTGFYAPQGRILRAQPQIEGFIDQLANINVNGHRITNLEMETGAIYGLSNILGHHCLSVNTILANRSTKKFSQNPKKSVENAIANTLEVLADSL